MPFFLCVSLFSSHIHDTVSAVLGAAIGARRQPKVAETKFRLVVDLSLPPRLPPAGLVRTRARTPGSGLGFRGCIWPSSPANANPAPGA